MSKFRANRPREGDAKLRKVQANRKSDIYAFSFTDVGKKLSETTLSRVAQTQFSDYLAAETKARICMVGFQSVGGSRAELNHFIPVAIHISRRSAA